MGSDAEMFFLDYFARNMISVLKDAFNSVK